MQKSSYILPAIAVIIFNEKGEILLQKRRDTGKWCIISGHVEYGETIENAVLREIKEETACEAVITRLIGIYSNPKSQTYYYAERNVQYVTSYFEAKLKETIGLNFSNEETEELRFFQHDRLPENMGQLNENWLHDVISNSNVPFIR